MTDRQTTTDTTYNLISVVYHSLQAIDSFHTYLRDAEETGDAELTGLLQGAIDQQRELAGNAKDMLAKRLAKKSA